MSRHALRRVTGCVLCVTAVLAAAGCDGDGTNSITFLDVLNTVFLGIAAAGGIAIIRNV